MNRELEMASAPYFVSQLEAVQHGKKSSFLFSENWHYFVSGTSLPSSDHHWNISNVVVSFGVTIFFVTESIVVILV